MAKLIDYHLPFVPCFPNTISAPVKFSTPPPESFDAILFAWRDAALAAHNPLVTPRWWLLDGDSSTVGLSLSLSLRHYALLPNSYHSPPHTDRRDTWRSKLLRKYHYLGKSCDFPSNVVCTWDVDMTRTMKSTHFHMQQVLTQDGNSRRNRMSTKEKTRKEMEGKSASVRE